LKAKGGSLGGCKRNICDGIDWTEKTTDGFENVVKEERTKAKD